MVNEGKEKKSRIKEKRIEGKGMGRKGANREKVEKNYDFTTDKVCNLLKFK